MGFAIVGPISPIVSNIAIITVNRNSWYRTGKQAGAEDLKQKLGGESKMRQDGRPRRLWKLLRVG